MSISLEKLPTELLLQIFAHVQTAQTLLRLALASKRLNDLIQSDGFRVFVQNRFPSIQTPPCWRDATHALTTLSRNWDRKAFNAHLIEPPKLQPLEVSHTQRGHRSQRRQQQTMGYQPVIDSYEIWEGGDWSSRKEVVAWGAGAELILRSKRTGQLAEREWHSPGNQHRRSVFDQHHHMHDWNTYRLAGATDGRDDITSLNLIPGHNRDPEQVFVGRASGALHHISLSVQESTSLLVGTYATQGRPVRSATISADPQHLLAACLADNAIALYSTSANGSDIQPTDEVAAVPPGTPGRTWSSKFLRNDRLAIGRGPSGQPILVYGINQTGFSKGPLRRFEVHDDDYGALGNHSTASSVRNTSVYPITPIAPSSAAGGAEGDIFLSGGYDGNVRLHDLRSPVSSTAEFVDIIDNSAIYSLLAFGRERFLAGASKHKLLKVFDLRMSGGKTYHYIDAIPDAVSHTYNQSVSSGQAHKVSGSSQPRGVGSMYPKNDYNLFLEPPGSAWRPRNNRRCYGREDDSPVYSMSAPSPYSPTFYAGVENAVIQLDVISAFDRHPDPVYSTGLRNDGRPLTAILKWDLNQDAINLRLYERAAGDLRIIKQLAPGSEDSRNVARESERKNGARYWDERWEII